jgi:hypothetical protein
MNRGARRLIEFAVIATLAVQLAAVPGIAETSAMVIRSGHVPDQDEQTWVQGSTEVRPGIQSSGLPLQHPYIIATPGYWGDLGGGAFWICSTPDGFDVPGGYEYFTEFTPPDDTAAAALDVMWRGDDTVKLAVNGTRLPGNGSAPPNGPPAILHADITSLVQKGKNRLRFLVENTQTTRNPTGIAFLANLTFARQPTTGPIRLEFMTLKSGHIERDSQVWVRGARDVQPGWVSSDLPLQNPFVINTPGYWGDLGGSAFWLSPSDDTTAPDGGYEYYLDFALPDNVQSATLDLQWRGNDFAIPAVNGKRLSGLGEFRPDRASSTSHANITPSIHPGSNRLSFFVWNAPVGFSPTGVVFQAIITYIH